MNSFLGVVLFCMQGQCAFWKSEILPTEEECQEVTVKTIETLMEKNMQLVQGVCFPLEMEKEQWQKTRG